MSFAEHLAGLDTAQLTHLLSHRPDVLVEPAPRSVRELALRLDSADSVHAALARVAVANFTGDEFDPDPDGRAQIFRSLSAPKVAALLFLDRPQGLEGHGAGADARFTQRYGACLLEFAEGRSSRC